MTIVGTDEYGYKSDIDASRLKAVRKIELRWIPNSNKLWIYI